MEGLKCFQICSNRNLIAKQKSSKHNTFLSKLILVKSLICCSIQLVIRDVREHGHSYTDGRAADVNGVVRVGGLDVELQDVVNKRCLD